MIIKRQNLAAICGFETLPSPFASKVTVALSIVAKLYVYCNVLKKCMASSLEHLGDYCRQAGEALIAQVLTKLPRPVSKGIAYEFSKKRVGAYFMSGSNSCHLKNYQL